MSWVEQLIRQLTIAQAKTLCQFLVLSEAGDRHRAMSSQGYGWLRIEWIGSSAGKPTHCRIQAMHIDSIDVVLSIRQAEAFKNTLRSELSRAFDKPNQTFFRAE